MATDLALALDRVAFARAVGIEKPDAWQQSLLRSEARRVILNCCRQSGKSTTSGVLALHRALYFPRSLVLVPSLRQSQELFSKIASSYRALDRPVSSQAERKLSLELENGSRIITLPGTEKTIRGFSGAALLIVDEARRIDDALYYSVRPMLAVSGGRLLVLSTPYGKRGVFHREWTEGSSWERYEVPATDCPRIPREFLEEERRTLPERIYRQEYECSFEETEDQVFSYEDVRGAISEEVAPLFGSIPSSAGEIGGVA